MAHPFLLSSEALSVIFVVVADVVDVVGQTVGTVLRGKVYGDPVHNLKFTVTSTTSHQSASPLSPLRRHKKG